MLSEDLLDNPAAFVRQPLRSPQYLQAVRSEFQFVGGRLRRGGVGVGFVHHFLFILDRPDDLFHEWVVLVRNAGLLVFGGDLLSFPGLAS